MENIGYFIRQERIKQNFDQNVFAEGICSNSYLSKIESGTSIGNEDLIFLLCDRLGYDFNNTIDEDFKILNDEIWHQFIFFDKPDSNLIAEASKLKQSKYLSNYSTDFFLLVILIQIISNEYDGNELPTSLTLSTLQKQRYDILNVIINQNTIFPNNTSYHDEIGLVTLYKSNWEFHHGSYYDSIRSSEKAFLLFSKNGNLTGMIDSSFVESNAYSNLDNLEQHEKISQRILNLNKIVCNEEVYFRVYYNLGSTYTVKGEFSKGKDYLLKCLGYHCDNFDYLHLTEKLLIISMFEKDIENFDKYLSQTKNNKEMFQLFSYIKEMKFDYKDNSVIPLLEASFKAESTRHHGRKLLYGSLLYQAYRANYQYPKALKLIESINPSKMMFFK